MFYMPWTLREWTEPELLNGPNWKGAKTYYIEVDSNRVSLKMPNVRCSTNVKALMKKPIKNYQSRKPNFEVAARNFVGDNLFSMFWDFYGKNFVRKLATVECHASIFFPKKPHETSCFHPRSFEKIIGDHCVSEIELLQVARHNLQTYLAPIDWNPCSTIMHVPAVRYTLEMNRSINMLADDQYEFLAALGDAYLFRVMFRVNRDMHFDKNNKGDTDKEKWLPIAPMKELVDNILNSIEIELSPQTKAQIEFAQAGLSDVSLINNFPPVKLDGK